MGGIFKYSIFFDKDHGLGSRAAGPCQKKEYLKAPPPNLEKGVKGGRNFLEVVYTGFHLLLNLSALVRLHSHVPMLHVDKYSFFHMHLGFVDIYRF